MSTLATPLREALGTWRAGRLGLAGLASWAADQLAVYFADQARKYAFRDDVALEALGLVAGAADAPEPELELEAAQALVRGESPFATSRLLLLDPAWVKDAACAAAAGRLSEVGARLDRGEEWPAVVAARGPALVAACEALAGDDYVELVCLEAAAVLGDLRLVVNGTVEVLGRGRPRIDASLLAERLASLGQVVRGERPMRVMLRARGVDAVQVVVSY